MKSWLLAKESSSFDWADLIVVPLIALLCIPSLIWFGHTWTVVGNDSARYLLAGSQFINGQALEGLVRISQFNGGHGPALPALIGLLILLFGHNPVPLAWAVRLLALLNPLLAYFLTKRISTPVAGLIAAASVTLFGFTVNSTIAIIIDPPLLTFYLLSLLALLAAIDRNSSTLAFLSGAFLALSILTKETAVVSLPLALLAVLLLDWQLPKALWHYLGVFLVCLPWWLWAYLATGDVYLMDRLPAQLKLPAVIAAALFLVLAVVAYASGMVERFLASERRRRYTGWILAFSWTVVLSCLALVTASRALEGLTGATLKLFLSHLLEPVIFVVPTLVVVLGYVVWKALRQGGVWRVLALVMLFQVPVCLLVTVERWAPRQFLILQALVFCALAALIVEAGAAALRGRDRSARWIGTVALVSLVVLLLVGSVVRVHNLLPQNTSARLSAHQSVAAPEIKMRDWMAKNVPEGKHVLVIAEPAINGAAVGVARVNYLTFLNSERYDLTPLQLDQAVCFATPNVPLSCNPEKDSLSRTRPDAIWIETVGRCNVISLSMSNLLEQMRRTNSDYVMISGSHVFPGILQLPPILQRSKAFELAHVEPPRGGVRWKRGVVLLKRTGREPKTISTQMSMNALLHLRRCEQAKGPRNSKKLKSTFPNGIVTIAGRQRKR